MDDMMILGGMCIALALWVLSLTRRLAKAEEFGFMAMMALRDVADEKVQIIRDKDGAIHINKLKE